MKDFFNKIFKKAEPSVYQVKDAHLNRTLRVKDFLALGVGTIVSTSTFHTTWRCCSTTHRSCSCTFILISGSSGWACVFCIC